MAVDEVALPVLAPGASVALSLLWDSLDKPGTTALVAVVDPDDAVEELDESDNFSAFDVEVTPAPAGAELAIDASEVLISPPQPAELPVDLAFSAVVRNYGLTDAAAVRVVLWKEGTAVAEATVDVPQRSSATASFFYQLTEPGEHPFTVEADPDNAVAESDETDNAATVTVALAAAVDLEVTAADLRLLEGAAVLGADVTFQVDLRNRGTVDVPEDFAVRVTVTDGLVEDELLATTLFLAAGGATTLEIPWRVDRLGALELVVALDGAGRVPESDESNNEARLPFSAVEPTGANLTLSSGDLVLDPNPAWTGATVALSVLARNTGAQALSDVAVDFYDGDPAAGGALIERVVIPSLDAGASADAVASFGPLPEPVEHLIVAVVDPDGAVAEDDEDDNVAFATLPVFTLPDLAVSATAVDVPEPGCAGGDATQSLPADFLQQQQRPSRSDGGTAGRSAHQRPPRDSDRRLRRR